MTLHAPTYPKKINKYNDCRNKKLCKCPLCCSKAPKQNNLNTPERKNIEEVDEDFNFSIIKADTRRNKPQEISSVRDDSILSRQGNTLLADDLSEIPNSETIISPIHLQIYQVQWTKVFYTILVQSYNKTYVRTISPFYWQCGKPYKTR